MFRDSVRIALFVAALNNLDVLVFDIQNAYLTAQFREKIWTRTGTDYGSESGCIMIVMRALYGLKSSGAAFCALLAETFCDLSYLPTKSDPDAWIRMAVKSNGFEYYEFVLYYFDGVLSISHDPQKTMYGIKNTFKLKKDKIEEPENYSGADISKMTTADGRVCWMMSSDQYCKDAVANVEEKLDKANTRFPTKCGAPLTSGYKPGLDTSADLKKDGLQTYQELIEVLRWAVEIGRIDILLEMHYALL